MEIGFKTDAEALNESFYSFVSQIFDQLNNFIQYRMKNQILKAMFANYTKMREELREKVNTPKTRRFFQLSSELFDMECGIYTWIGLASGMQGDKSTDELNTEMMQALENHKYRSKKIERQILQSEIADLFDQSDFSTLMALWGEILNLQRQSCLASGKYIGNLLYQAFTVPNKDILSSYLNIDLEEQGF